MHARANGPFVSRPLSPEKKEGNNDITPIIHIWLSSGIAVPQGGAKPHGSVHVGGSLVTQLCNILNVRGFPQHYKIKYATGSQAFLGVNSIEVA